MRVLCAGAMTNAVAVRSVQEIVDEIVDLLSPVSLCA
jgi:hypothetical protein